MAGRMKKYVWEEIESFRSMREFEKFLNWIEFQVSDGSCSEVHKDMKKSMLPPQYRYFRQVGSTEVWKLLYPDPGYFSGAWKIDISDHEPC